MTDSQSNEGESHDPELIAKARELALESVTPAMDLDQRMEVFEAAMMQVLDVQIMQPFVGSVGANITRVSESPPQGRWLMGDDPRLPPMPSKPTLKDFFDCRFTLHPVGGQHLFQSAACARKNGLSSKIVMACLLHDISVVSLVRTDHGHWAASLIEPYVDEEVTWAVKHHSALRFRPDPKLGYEYPKAYLKNFGDDYTVPDYIRKEWDYCITHKYYESAMQVCLNDLYAFDRSQSKMVADDFADIIEAEFRQPKEGLGFDGSSSAHMWRTIIWPNNFL